VNLLILAGLLTLAPAQAQSTGTPPAPHTLASLVLSVELAVAELELILTDPTISEEALAAAQEKFLALGKLLDSIKRMTVGTSIHMLLFLQVDGLEQWLLHGMDPNSYGPGSDYTDSYESGGCPNCGWGWLGAVVAPVAAPVAAASDPDPDPDPDEDDEEEAEEPTDDGNGDEEPVPIACFPRMPEKPHFVDINLWDDAASAAVDYIDAHPDEVVIGILPWADQVSWGVNIYRWSVLDGYTMIGCGPQ